MAESPLSLLEPISGVEDGRLPTGFLYFAAGSLSYGGELHGLLAGSVFAGRGGLKGYSLVECRGYLLLAKSSRESVEGELYYVDPLVVEGIEKWFSRLGFVARSSGVVEHSAVSLPVELHYAKSLEECKPAKRVEARENRYLLALPPLLPPPAQPLASYPAILEGFEPCREGLSYCPSLGARVSTAVVDVVVYWKRLREWVESVNAFLAPGLALAGRYRVYPQVVVSAASRQSQEPWPQHS